MTCSAATRTRTRATTSTFLRSSSSAPLPARLHFATRAVDLAGDLAVEGGHPGHGVPPRPWTWLRQVHGAVVVEVRHPGEHAGIAADAAVTAAPGCALLVRTADCAPVALLADQAVGIAHAGWRGLELGVVDAAVSALRRLGAGTVRAVVGPCISAARYEFGAADLDRLAGGLGDGVRSTTPEGRPALDLTAGVVAALRASGVDDVAVEGSCTARDAARWFSHRARAEDGRQGSFVWLTELG